MSDPTSNDADPMTAEQLDEFQYNAPERQGGPLWSLLDWSFWGAGMADTFREPLASTMLAAVPENVRAQAEAIMADFIERRKIEKTGVTIYQEQSDEVERLTCALRAAEDERDQLGAQVAEYERLSTSPARDEATGLETLCALLHAAPAADPNVVKDLAWRTFNMIRAFRELGAERDQLAATVQRVRNLTRSTDGDDLDGDSELPVGLFQGALDGGE
jgi:hypothetical protein